MIAHECHMVRYDDFIEGCTILKSILTDFLDTFGKFKIFQLCATVKSAIADLGNAILDHDLLDRFLQGSPGLAVVGIVID